MAIDIAKVVSDELSIPLWQVANALQLLAEGNTIPFIARYRKEKTGDLNEIQLRSIEERNQYLAELETRKEVILKSIEEQGKLTDALREAITASTQKNELEDLYLPYRPRRRTRATAAREKGLQPFADWLREKNESGAMDVDFATEALGYINEANGITSVAEALSGASDILAEEIVSENVSFRASIRKYLMDTGTFVSRIKEEHAPGTTQFEMYREYQVPVRSIAAHNMLALRRGEEEGILFFNLEFDSNYVLAFLNGEIIKSQDEGLQTFFQAMITDAFERLMKNTLVGEVRMMKKEEADEQSIQTFASNLRELLLSSPAGLRPTLGIDPGFRTGCKVALIDATGKYLETVTIYPHSGHRQHDEASRVLTELIENRAIELIAVGNGTAGRETMQFVNEVLAPLERKPIVVMVSEAGASVYSASDVAIREFPSLDLTVRGAISIGRRLQDPLAELVKIEPKSIGVGQYQHDVDQNLLKKKLEETVESCVNYVGVDLNTASAELLKYVAGITPSLAKNIVEYRNSHGVFRNRSELLSITRFGPRAYEQAAGFLRIRDGENPLDNTGVHPERYAVVETIANDLGVAPAEITHVPDRLKKVELKRYVSEELGMMTLKDILSELEKPGRDPREAFQYATFRDDVTQVAHLKPGMILEGVVTNVANFGAFVDVGVHRDGLVHVSQLGDRYVKDATTVVKVGQVVNVRVLEVNETLNRISLSMRLEDKPLEHGRRKGRTEEGGQRRKEAGEHRGSGQRSDGGSEGSRERKDHSHGTPGRREETRAGGQRQGDVGAGGRPGQRAQQKSGTPDRKDGGWKPQPKREETRHYTLEDLVRKFNSR